MKAEKEIAIQAARQAGELMRSKLGRISRIDYKSAFNLVTEVDKAAEEIIISTIKNKFETDRILAEESGEQNGNKEGCSTNRRWIIDPLDGTTNFAHSYPFFSVSIAFELDKEIVLGVVYNPISDELFTAEKDKGAYCNDRAISVSTRDSLNNSLLATGFPPDTRKTEFSNMREFNHLTDISHGVRRDGSAALDLCFVACGRIEGFWEMKLSPWDVAAGSLIVNEAGGRTSNLEGGPLDIDTGHIAATNGLIHEDLIKELNSIKTSHARVL